MGLFSSEADPPVYMRAVDTRDCVRYTDVVQAQWFMDRIEFAYGGSTGVHVEPDGETIKWFGFYFLRMGDWLYAGTTPIDDVSLRESSLRPLDSTWPTGE